MTYAFNQSQASGENKIPQAGLLQHVDSTTDIPRVSPVWGLPGYRRPPPFPTASTRDVSETRPGKLGSVAKEGSSLVDNAPRHASLCGTVVVKNSVSEQRSLASFWLVMKQWLHKYLLSSSQPWDYSLQENISTSSQIPFQSIKTKIPFDRRSFVYFTHPLLLLSPSCPFVVGINMPRYRK